MPSSNAPHSRNIPLFAGLPADILDGLLASSRVRHFPVGRSCAAKGTPANDLLLLEGRPGPGQPVRRGWPGGGAGRVDAPASFGEISLIDGMPRAATLIALTDIQVRYLGRRQVMDLAERVPGVAMAMLRSMAAMVRATNDRLVDVVALDVPARLARWLLAQAGESGHLVVGSPRNRSEPAWARPGCRSTAPCTGSCGWARSGSPAPAS